MAENYEDQLDAPTRIYSRRKAKEAADVVGGDLDDHVTILEIHRELDDSITTAANQWSGSKIQTKLDAQTHVLADITDSGAMAAVADDPNDGEDYVRSGNAWVQAAYTDHLTRPYRSVSVGATLGASDWGIVLTGSGAITLPTAVGVAGREYHIKSLYSFGSITVRGTSSQTIDGATSKSLAFRATLWVRSNGANWDIL